MDLVLKGAWVKVLFERPLPDLDVVFEPNIKFPVKGIVVENNRVMLFPGPGERRNVALYKC